MVGSFATGLQHESSPRLTTGPHLKSAHEVEVTTGTPAITLHVCGQLRTYVGGASALELSARSVRDALGDLERRHATLYRNVCDETGVIRRHLNVFVNADHIRDLDGIDTALKPGDLLTILPAVSGG
jgi:molybdopterin synthase sulfur carrier subunit